MKTRLFMLFVLACSATAAWSAPPPKNASYVDPDAPCFRWPAVDYDADGVFDRIDRCTNTPAGCTVDKWGCESDADGDGVYEADVTLKPGPYRYKFVIDGDYWTHDPASRILTGFLHESFFVAGASRMLPEKGQP